MKESSQIVEKIVFNGILIAELKSKQDWINRVPHCLPEKIKAEQRIWIDANCNCLAIGEDFSNAEIMASYPVKVYRQVRVTDVYNVYNPKKDG